MKAMGSDPGSIPAEDRFLFHLRFISTDIKRIFGIRSETHYTFVRFISGDIKRIFGIKWESHYTYLRFISSDIKRR